MDLQEFIKEEGRQQGMQQVILNFLKKKFEVSLISEVTGAFIEEIKKLKTNHCKKSVLEI